MFELDSIDRKILGVLQDQGRITNLELAERVGLSSAPCLRRVKSLEENGVIRKYVALVDNTRIGLDFNAIVEIRLKQQTREFFELFEKRVAGLPEVVECCLIAGDWDYSLRVVSANLARYQAFILDRLMFREHEIASFRTTIIMKKVKATTFVDVNLADP